MDLVRRRVSRIEPNASSATCWFSSQDWLKLSRFIGGFVRAGGEIEFDPTAPIPLKECRMVEERPQRPKELYFGQIGYAAQPKADKRGEYISDERLDPASRDIYKCPVMLDRSMPKELRQQCKRMVGESRIDERFLSLQGLNRAAARLPIVIKRRIDQFREELGHGAQSSRGTPVRPVPWLTEHELAARRVVPEIEPIVHGASLSARFFGNQLSRPATVNAADHNIDAVQVRSRAEMVRYSVPIQVPEEIDPRCENHRFRLPDF